MRQALLAVILGGLRKDHGFAQTPVSRRNEDKVYTSGFKRFLGFTGIFPVLLLAILTSQPLYSQAGTRVFVWVRPASEADLQLSAKDAPNLRKLARCGAALPRLGSIDAEVLASELRKSGASLPEGKFRELGQKAGGDGKPPVSDALARLRAKFGKPKAPKTVEKKAPQTSAATAKLVSNVFSSFDGGARLVLKKEPAMTASAEHCRELDKRIGEMISEFNLGINGGEVALVVVLVPATGRPALLAAGGGFKRARICKGSPGGGDIAAGVASLIDPGSKTTANWNWILNLLEKPTAKALQERRRN